MDVDADPPAPVAMSVSDDDAAAHAADTNAAPAAAAEASSPPEASAASAPAASSPSDDDDDGPSNGRSRRSSSRYAPSAAGLEMSVNHDYDDLSESSASEYDAAEFAAATGTWSPEDLEAQLEGESATACGLPAQWMSPLEQAALPEFAQHYSALYVELRNTICRQWQKELTAYLTFETYARRSDLHVAKLGACARRVFDFLNLHGFINSGLLPPSTGTPQGRPSEQIAKRSDSTVHMPPVRRAQSDTSAAATAAPARADSTTASLVKTEESVPLLKQEDEPMQLDAGAVKSEPQGSPLSPTPATPLLALSLNGSPAPMDVAASAAVTSPSSAPMSAAPAPVASPAPSARRRILIVGAGASGLAAARQLQSFGHTVTVIEGRNRTGGRVNTIRDKFSAPVDLGASIMTGLLGSPLSVLCKQYSQREFGVGFTTVSAMAESTVHAPAQPFPHIMHYIRPRCDLFDAQGVKVGKQADTEAFNLFNKQLEGSYAIKRHAGYECPAPAEQLLTHEQMDKIRLANPEKLFETDLETGMELTRTALNMRLSPLDEKLVDWHKANLEYGCAAELKKLSLVYWDQDDGEAWRGDHALIKPGFGMFIDQLAQGVDIRFNQHVQSITYAGEDNSAVASSSPNSTAPAPVSVHVLDKTTGESHTFEGDVVLCTASLGVLKTGAMTFQPPLPAWKRDAISSLGFGLLNKLILEFPTPFWRARNDHDMFGYLHPGPSSSRGKFYIFWNLQRSTGKPILAALCAGEAAHTMEHESEADLVTECMGVLRAIHRDQVVPEPVRTHQTKWSQDEFARGSYSFLAAGNNGKEYDLLAQNVGSTLFFAGEACNKDYPATVPGAYLSGLRAAGQMQAMLAGWSTSDPGASVLKELTRHPKTQAQSKPDSMANAVAQQAQREINQEGESGDAALQLKVAEILARQQRKRRGIRMEMVPTHVQDEEHQPQEARENMALRLAAAAQLLKRGMFAPPRENVKAELAEDHRYAHIARFEGEVERPFDALRPDTQGLSDMVSFNDFDLGAPGGAAETAEQRARRHAHKRSKHGKQDKHARSKSDHRSHSSSQKKRSRDDDARRSGKHLKKHKSSSGASSSSSAPRTPAHQIHRHVHKVATSVAHSQGHSSSKLISAVRKKAAGKVVEDWESKPRGDLQVKMWLNDKRKEKIQQLVEKYMHIFAASRSGQTGTAEQSPPAAAAAAASQPAYSQLPTSEPPQQALYAPLSSTEPTQEQPPRVSPTPTTNQA